MTIWDEQFMNNKDAFELAKKYIPGGVNSPVRAFAAVGGEPFFTAYARDCYLYDVENKQYIDYICSWGTNIVGHAHPDVINQVNAAVQRGFSFGTPTEYETALVQKIMQFMPNIQKMRLVSSGTEACMSAIRLARGYTNKKYVIKFAGCYHGHSDNLLVQAGSGVATFNTSPSSQGVLDAAIEHTLVLTYNSIDEIKAAFARYHTDIACVMIEPIAGNMNLVRPTIEFMRMVRELCTVHSSVLIFDEVMTGFRVAKGGAQELFGIVPDLVTLGKVIGGGMPLAGFGGRAEIMDCLAPLGSVYQAGTLSGNPIAVACGLATLDVIEQDPNFYAELSIKSQRLVDGLKKLAVKYAIEFEADCVGGMFGFYFNQSHPQNFAQMQLANRNRFNRFFHVMLDSGVYFAPSMYEAGFICAKHTDVIIDATLEHAEDAFSQMLSE